MTLTQTAAQAPPLRKWILLIQTTIGWFALIAQFYIYLYHSTLPLTETLIRFFSYFTILVNIGVAMATTTQLLYPSDQDRFFKRPKVITAITVYITIVGLIYNTILSSLWNPRGLQYIVDLLLHTIIPLLSILYWYWFVLKKDLSAKAIWPWLLFPLIYSGVVLGLGSQSGYYPYPFLDINKYGLARILVNCALMLVAFLLLSFLYVGVARWTTRYKQ